MTTSQMLTELRTLLDEATEGFWSDDEIYVALTTGQMEITNHLLQVYKKGTELGAEANLSTALSALITKDFGKANIEGVYVFNSASPYFLYLVRCTYGSRSLTYYPCVVRTLGKEKDFEDNNIFLAGCEEEPTVALSGAYNSDGTVFAGRQQLEFKPIPTVLYGHFHAWFIKKPLDITVSQEPESHVSTHKAMVQRAFVELLTKAERDTKGAYVLYNQLLGAIL